MEQEIVQEESGNYIKIKGKAGETRSEKIFSYEDIPCFLPLEIRCINGVKEYYYPISGKVTLKQYLTETEFHLKDIKILFAALFEMVEVLEDYLLDSRGLMIREDMIFIERNSQKIYGIYQEDNEKDFVVSIGGLLEFIMEKMNQKEKDLVFFVYGMHKQTKEENCSRQMLKEYVGQKEEPQREHILPEAVVEPKKQYSAPKKNPYFHKVKPVAAGIAGAGLICPLILWKSGVFTSAVSGETDYGRLAGAVLFFLAVSGYGIWRLSVLGKNKTAAEFEAVREGEKKVCLIPQVRGGEPIPVTEFPFRMGSDKEFVHFAIDSEDVSPFHAEIRQEGGSIMIIDEESVYGTYRNGQQLVPWQPVLLQDGDVIRFARWEYVVEITSRYMSCEQ